MRFQLRFAPEQLIDFQLLLEEHTERAAKMGPALRMVVQVFLESQKAQFASKSGWAPLTVLTQQSKERRGFPEVMVETGTLKAALTHRYGTKYASSKSSQTWALMGTSDPGARLQAFGTQERVQTKTGRRTGKVTPRTMAFVNEVMIGQFYNILQTYLVTGEVTPGTSPFAGLGL